MSSRDLTGRWDGIFNYPRELPPNGFVAVLVDHDGALTGEVEEVSDHGADRGGQIAAVIEGERIGSQVRFTKRYDDLRRAHYAVRYDGTLAPDGNEIAGEWTIPGIWPGSFIMVRMAGTDETIEQAVGAEVR